MKKEGVLQTVLGDEADSIVGRILTVVTNAKGDRSKGSQELQVEIKAVKVVQSGNPSIIADEVVTSFKPNLSRFLPGLKEQHKGRKISLGGNTKVK